MIDNIKLFQISLNNFEPLIDDFYIKKGTLIITKEPNTKNKLMKDNAMLIELVSTYNFALKNSDDELKLKVIEKIISLTDGNKELNFSELFSFFAIIDISYSIYSSLSLDVKKKVLKKILEKYIELRHEIYSMYGYSPVTLQVGKDAKAHKESGNLGLLKVGSILDSFGYGKANEINVNDFLYGKQEKLYIETDKKGKSLFKEIISKLNLKFEWSSDKDEKMPDFLIKNRNDIFIVEHKHIKEFGGGQFKQVNEIISLIGCNEDNQNIHYIGFLDGIYFNYFINAEHFDQRDGKIKSQLNNIIINLKNNKNNYFINTAGFIELMKNLG